MKYIYRKYTENDYSACEELVNRAWDFDTVFQPQKMADVAKEIYTKGAMNESTYHSVAEANGQVVGFIFGINEHTHKPKLHLGMRLNILWRILRIKKSTPCKKELLNAMAEHEKNRSEHIGKRRSEIVLFVVSSSHQGKGVGKYLWSRFLKNCMNSDITDIIVETNQNGASGFYEKIGFRHLANFHSPLHEFATPNGQACIYVYKTET